MIFYNQGDEWERVSEDTMSEAGRKEKKEETQTTSQLEEETETKPKQDQNETLTEEDDKQVKTQSSAKQSVISQIINSNYFIFIFSNLKNDWDDWDE